MRFKTTIVILVLLICVASLLKAFAVAPGPPETSAKLRSKLQATQNGMVAAMAAEVIPWQNMEVLTGTHDPSIIRDERGVYSLVSTNNLCTIQQSTDMVHWQSKGKIFSAVPSWMK